MTIEEIDRLAELQEDARDDPDPRDKPYFSRWTISGRLNQDDWTDVEIFLADKGIRIENIEDAI